VVLGVGSFHRHTQDAYLSSIAPPSESPIFCGTN
jgi:hypothetical protein